MDAPRKDNIETGSLLESDQEPIAFSPAQRKDVRDPVSPARRRRLTKRRAAQLSLALIVLCAAGTYGWHWWTVGRFLETTDDAYLQADKVIVSPRIAGYIAEVLV